MPRRKPLAHGHTHLPLAEPGDLRARGRRLTRQRQLIWDTITVEPDQHLSADDIVDRVRTRLPQVNPSTVYRTLDLLVTEGLLLRTDLGADRAYFEPAHDHPHHHLVCDRCGAVTHAHDEALGDLRRRVESGSGFVIGTGEITLFGLCANCRPRQPRSS